MCCVILALLGAVSRVIFRIKYLLSFRNGYEFVLLIGAPSDSDHHGSVYAYRVADVVSLFPVPSAILIGPSNARLGKSKI